MVFEPFIQESLFSTFTYRTFTRLIGRSRGVAIVGAGRMGSDYRVLFKG